MEPNHGKAVSTPARLVLTAPRFRWKTVPGDATLGRIRSAIEKRTRFGLADAFAGRARQRSGKAEPVTRPRHLNSNPSRRNQNQRPEMKESVICKAAERTYHSPDCDTRRILIGGRTQYVDTEDVAVKGPNENCPGRFSHGGSPDQINIEKLFARFSYLIAKKQKKWKGILGELERWLAFNESGSRIR